MKIIATLLIIFAVLAAALHGLSRFLHFHTNYPLWLWALGTAIIAALMQSAFQYERRAITPKRAAWIHALRIFSLLLILWMLLQPTLVRRIWNEKQNQLVIIYDESASMQLTDEGATSSRINFAKDALEKSNILQELEKEIIIHKVSVARGTGDEKSTELGWDQATDLHSALQHTLDLIPPDQLAGAILLTDGRHNRPNRVEDPARRFGMLDAPIGIIAVGSEKPPRDAAIMALRSPDAVHLGDRMRITATVKLDGYKGKQAKVILKQDEKIIEEKTISSAADQHTEEIMFLHTPEEGGVGGFSVEIGKLDDERFAENNTWSFETSITDARINVLLLESHPRWEYRYLRNLFYGRDKSIHLQHVLLNPDQIEGQNEPAVYASATRPFGDAAATRLPENADEWKKFDVIIIGDVAPEAIDENAWIQIKENVTERAALLVFIAGPRHMPHALTSQTARSLVPMEMEWGAQTHYRTDSPPFHIYIAQSGLSHSLNRIGGSALSSPELSWRHSAGTLREGAETILTATPPANTQASSANDLTNALASLARQKDEENKNALFVTQRIGRGKSALLLSDQTWRLREGAGDTFHHRFWGSIMQWGAGEILRSGNAQTRLGTDRLTYTPGEPIIIKARLRDEKMNPLTEEKPQAEILLDEKMITTAALIPADDAPGYYEATINQKLSPGLHTIKLSDDVSTTFRVISSPGPIELADVTRNDALLQTIATLSAGKSVVPEKTSDLLTLFDLTKLKKEEIRETTLWDHPIVLILLLAALTAAWQLRRKIGFP